MKPRNPVRVIRSCISPDQIGVAMRFAELWLAKMGLPPKGETMKAFHAEAMAATMKVFSRGRPGEEKAENVLHIEPKKHKRNHPHEAPHEY